MDSLDALGIVPSVATQGRQKPRVLVATFGDGYEQRSQDGINAGLKEWSVQWNVITKTQLGTLATFFETQGAWKKFTWTQPAPFDTAGALAFICEEWSWQYAGGNIVGLSATLMQRPAV